MSIRRCSLSRFLSNARHIPLLEDFAIYCKITLRTGPFRLYFARSYPFSRFRMTDFDFLPGRDGDDDDDDATGDDAADEDFFDDEEDDFNADVDDNDLNDADDVDEL